MTYPMTRLHVLWLGFSLLLGGCVSLGAALPQDAIDKLHQVHVVAMESHPLGVPAGPRPSIVGSSGMFDEARGIALFYTGAILFALPEASRRGEEISKSYQAALDREGAWVPTLVLANEVRAQLAAKEVETTVAPGVKPIPGVKDRSYTALMENWLAPTRAWYNDTSPVADYGDLPNDPSLYVLEVGMINYEIVPGGSLMVQVAMKVIDPATGRVMGRARAANSWELPDLSPLDQTFSGNASRFKEAFIQTGREIVRKCLGDLGLLPPGRE